MKEFRVIWQVQPYDFNPEQVLFVTAANEDDAKAIAQDHVERKFGIARFGVRSASIAKATPKGRVLADFSRNSV